MENPITLNKLNDWLSALDDIMIAPAQINRDTLVGELRRDILQSRYDLAVSMVTPRETDVELPPVTGSKGFRSQPRRRVAPKGQQKKDLALKADCPTCGAVSGNPCFAMTGPGANSKVKGDGSTVSIFHRARYIAGGWRPRA